MTKEPRRTPETTPEDQAFLDGVRHAGGALRHPFVIGVGAVLAAALLFRLGIAAGEALFSATNGDTPTVVLFGAASVILLAAIVGLGVWLDRRRRVKDGPTAPPSGGQGD